MERGGCPIIFFFWGGGPKYLFLVWGAESGGRGLVGGSSTPPFSTIGRLTVAGYTLGWFQKPGKMVKTQKNHQKKIIAVQN